MPNGNKTTLFHLLLFGISMSEMYVCVCRNLNYELIEMLFQTKKFEN